MMTQLSLSQAVKEWLDTHIESTRTSYRYVMQDLIKSYGDKDYELREITAHQLSQYMQDVNSRESVKSKATYNKYVITVKAFFSWAIDEDLITRNPARRLKRLRRSKLVRKDKAMSSEELAITSKYCRRQINEDTIGRRGEHINVSHYRNYALILFLADTGCRIGGAANLKITDLDLDEQKAIVTEKGNKTREVWFGHKTTSAIREWIYARSEWLQQEGYVLNDVYVFQREGHKMTSSSLGQVVRRICQRAGVRSLGPHSLRHRKGHQLQKTTDVVTAAMVLGHSSPDTTMAHYYKADTEEAERVARELVLGIQADSDDGVNEQSSKIIDLSDYLAG